MLVATKQAPIALYENMRPLIPIEPAPPGSSFPEGLRTALIIGGITLGVVVIGVVAVTVVAVISVAIFGKLMVPH